MKIRTLMPSLEGDELLINGKRFIKDREKVTLVYFWSISCKECEKSLISLKELQQRFPQQLAIIMIHMPRNEQDQQIEVIKNKIRQAAIKFPVIVDQQLRLTNAFENRIVPAYYVFDEQQQLRFYKAGFTATKMLEQKVARIIR